MLTVFNYIDNDKNNVTLNIYVSKNTNFMPFFEKHSQLFVTGWNNYII